MATVQAKERSSNHASDMLAQWRHQYAELEDQHRDLEKDYWQQAGQYHELQVRYKELLNLLSPSRS